MTNISLQINFLSKIKIHYNTIQKAPMTDNKITDSLSYHILQQTRMKLEKIQHISKLIFYQ